MPSTFLDQVEKRKQRSREGRAFEWIRIPSSCDARFEECVSVVMGGNVACF